MVGDALAYIPGSYPGSAGSNPAPAPHKGQTKGPSDLEGPFVVFMHC